MDIKTARAVKGCFIITVLLLVLQTECRGGGRGGGGGRSSGGSRSSSYGGSRSSSYGSSHSTSHNYGSSHSVSHTYTGSGSTGGSRSTGHIGFERFGSGHNTVYKQQTSIPYKPQTVVYTSGRTQYHPPLHQQYTAPVYQHVPVYQPVYVQSRSSSSGNAGSFLGGYLVGRLSGSGGYNSQNHYYHHHHYDDNNNNINNDNYYTDDQKNVYTVHHYHQNREEVPSRYSIPGDNTVECRGDTSDKLCVPNTHGICLRNGTIMCVTPISFTLPCDNTTKSACVYSKIECAGKPPCDTYQTYIDFYLPCISNVTLVNDRIVDSSSHNTSGNYELCVTAIAQPKKLESPVSALFTLVTELGKWHVNNVLNVTNVTNTTYAT